MEKLSHNKDNISQVQKIIESKLHTFGFRKEDNLMYSFGIVGFMDNNKVLVVPCLNTNFCTQIANAVKILVLQGFDVEVGNGFWNFDDSYVFDSPETPTEIKESFKEKSLERRLLERAFGPN